MPNSTEIQRNHFQTIILGGGLSGLSLAHRILHDQPQHCFCLLEKNQQTGGAIWSYKKEGILAEPGPHGFLDNCQESRQLLLETGLEKVCQRASLQEFVRYVFHEGKLKLIAQSPGKILIAPLISPAAKLGILRDLWKPPLAGEPTVAEWTVHRFGSALLPYLDAVFTGTYAGDIEKLTIDSVMPGVRALEKKHGSVIRGLLARRKKAKAESSPPRRRQLPAMTSFPEGMQQFVDKLKEPLKEGKNLFCNSETTKIVHQKEYWQVTAGDKEFTADNLVLALPVNVTLKLLRSFAPPLLKVPETTIANIAMTFSDRVHIPRGFGFLVPEQEKRFILGTLFSSNMYAGRAPGKSQLVEVLVGGRRHPERLELPDKELVDRAVQDLQDILNIQEKPLFCKRLPSPGSFPQLERGYPALLSWKENLEATTQGLHICGFGWGGIGINDMIKGSFRVAGNLLSAQQRQEEVKVKPVYF